MISINGDKTGSEGVVAAVAAVAAAAATGLTRCLGTGLVRIFFVFKGEIGLGIDLDLDLDFLDLDFFFSETIEFGSLYMPINGACCIAFEKM